MKILGAILATVGSLAAIFGTSACAIFLIDEPKCPESLIK